MPEQIIGNMINGVIRKKLENIVLDTMDHPTDLPEDFDEIVDIAKENNFFDILTGIDEIDREIGKTQREKIFERRKTGINQREKELENYFVNNPKNLNKIEPGLTYVGHQVVTKAGRLDVFTRDKENKDVTIEFKAVDDNSKKNFPQIKKYYHQNEKGRVIFVAPEVRGDLVISLKDLHDSKKVRFLRYQMINGEFKSKEMAPEDFPDAQPINWITKDRKTNGLIRVTSAGRGKQLKSKAERLIQEEKTKEISSTEEKGFIGGEEIEKGTFNKERDSYPLYYKVLLTTKPELENKEKYLKPIKIEGKQFERLENLLFSQDLASALEEAKEHVDWFIPANELSNLGKGNSLALPYEGMNVTDSRNKFYKNYHKALKYSKEISSNILNCFMLLPVDCPKYRKDVGLGGKNENAELQNVLMMLKGEQSLLSRKIKNAKYGDKDIRDLRETITKFYKFLKKGFTGEDLNVNERFYRAIDYMISFSSESLVNEFIKIKIARTEELMKLDKNLALSYLTFSPDGSKENLKIYLASDPKNLDKNIESRIDKNSLVVPDLALDKVSVNISSELQDFVERDQELYESFLTYFKVKEEPVKESSRISQKKKAQLESLVETSDLNLKLSKHKEDGDFDEENPKDIDVSKLISRGVGNGNIAEGVSVLHESFKYFNTATNIALHYLFTDVENKSLEGMEKCKELFNNYLHEIDGGIKKAPKALRKVKTHLEKLAKKQNDPFIASFVEKYMGFTRARLLNEFLDLKIKRYKELADIDEKLAKSYLNYSIPLVEAGLPESLEEVKKMNLAHIKIKPLIARDTQLYQSILENLVVREEPVEIVTEATKPEVVGLEVKPEAQERAEHRKTKTHYGYPVSSVIPNRVYESLGKDKQMIVNEFVNGILNNLEYNNSTRKKYASLARESKWYNKNMDAKQVRDFFGNLAINIEEECDKSKEK